MTVRVTALRYHTLRGEEHQPGDVYEVDDQDLGNLQGQGMAAFIESVPEPQAAPIETES